MTKDLIGLLKAQQAEENGGIPEHTNVVVETPDYLTQFFTEVEEIRSLIDSIESNIEIVKTRHSDILSSPSPKKQTKDELEDAMAAIKTTANKVRTKLKNIEPDQNAVDDGKADLRIRKTQHAALSRKFVEAMSTYNACQLSFRDRCKFQIKRQFESADINVTMEEVEEILESEKSANVFTQELITDTIQAKKSLAEIEERHADILKLEKSIKELHDLFMDMAILVEAQGELVDRIEYNVTNAKEYIEDAKQQTTQAVQYSKSARKKKIICFGILGGVLGVIILVLIIYFSVG